MWTLKQHRSLQYLFTSIQFQSEVVCMYNIELAHISTSFIAPLLRSYLCIKYIEICWIMSIERKHHVLFYTSWFVSILNYHVFLHFPRLATLGVCNNNNEQRFAICFPLVLQFFFCSSSNGLASISIGVGPIHFQYILYCGWKTHTHQRSMDQSNKLHNQNASERDITLNLREKSFVCRQYFL